MKIVAITFILFAVTFATGLAKDEPQQNSSEPEIFLFPEILCIHKNMIKLTKDRQDLSIWLDNRERSFMRLALHHSVCKMWWGKMKTKCLARFQKSIDAFRKNLEAQIPAKHKDFIPNIMKVVSNCLKI